MNARVADASGWDRQRRYELTHEHLVVRLALTVGGSLAAAAASAMSWTHGLVSATGPLNDGRLDGDGMYTAVLALAVIGCATWYYARPEDLAARVGAALAGALLLFAIVDWNVASDDVETANLGAPRRSDRRCGRRTVDMARRPLIVRLSVRMPTMGLDVEPPRLRLRRRRV
jgi:hypothetical protein